MHITERINKLNICFGAGPYSFTHKFHAVKYAAVVPYVYAAAVVLLQFRLNDLNY